MNGQHYINMHLINYKMYQFCLIEPDSSTFGIFEETLMSGG